MKSKILPSLWFDANAHEAMKFYASVFPDSDINMVSPVVVTATLAGVPFVAINGGPVFTPNTSISFMLVCESTDEIDAIWSKLSENGEIYMQLDSYPWSKYYGWISDQFGFSWQLYLGKLKDVNHQRIVPTLMFAHSQQGNCEKAIGYYQSIFNNSQLQGIQHYDDGSNKGQVLHAQFAIEGFLMAAMDSGVPQNFTFNEAISFTIQCKGQEEIDYYWEALTQKGQESQCGWCKDAFGVSWQVVPHNIEELLFSSPNAEKASYALFKMKKINIKELENA